jgi:hypothetical protein
LEVKLHVLLPITFLFCLKLANKHSSVVVLPVLEDQRVSLVELFLSESCECQYLFFLCSEVWEKQVFALIPLLFTPALEFPDIFGLFLPFEGIKGVHAIPVTPVTIVSLPMGLL